MKQTIRLTESELRGMIKRTINEMVSEESMVDDILLDDALEEAVYDFCERHDMENIAHTLQGEVCEAVHGVLMNAIRTMEFINKGHWKYR